MLSWARGLRTNGILGLNERNAQIIQRFNTRKLFPLVDDKLRTKRLALKAGIVKTGDDMHVRGGRGGEVQITDAIMGQAKAGRVLAYKFRGKRFDCGSVEGFVEATNFVYGEMER